MQQEKIEKKLIKSWQILAKNWNLLGSPGRPSKNEIKTYRQACEMALKGKKKARALVMGSTPEIRDILAGYKNTQTVIVDNLLDMMLGMTEVMKKKNENEIWVKSDWTKAPYPENYFDIILADWTSGNLPFDKQPAYYSNTSKWLKKTGLCAEKTMGFKKEELPMTMNELNDYCEGKKISKDLCILFWECGMFYLDPPVGRIVRVSLFKKRLAEYIKNNPKSISAKILKQSSSIYPTNKIWFIPTEKNLDQIVKKYFKIVNKVYDSAMNMPDLYKRMGAIYYMTKK